VKSPTTKDPPAAFGKVRVSRPSAMTTTTFAGDLEVADGAFSICVTPSSSGFSMGSGEGDPATYRDPTDRGGCARPPCSAPSPGPFRAQDRRQTPEGRRRPKCSPTSRRPSWARPVMAFLRRFLLSTTSTNVDVPPVEPAISRPGRGQASFNRMAGRPPHPHADLRLPSTPGWTDFRRPTPAEDRTFRCSSLPRHGRSHPSVRGDCGATSGAGSPTAPLVPGRGWVRTTSHGT